MPTAADETFTRIDYLARVMKAPRIRESARRLADQAAAQAWTGPQYLQAVLEAEVAAREASGAKLRLRAAGFPGGETCKCVISGSVVPEEGFEPSRCCHRRILSPLRLPFRHSGVSMHKCTAVRAICRRKRYCRISHVCVETMRRFPKRTFNPEGSKTGVYP